MNKFWIDLFLILFEVLIISATVYEVVVHERFHSKKNWLVISILYFIILVTSVQLIVQLRRMFYNFGFWFSCYY
jgi:hypothetical protein